MEIDKRRNLLPIPEFEVETYWTNLYEEPEAVIELYHAHGTSEQYHSELNIERLPSGKMVEVFQKNTGLQSSFQTWYNSLR